MSMVLDLAGRGLGRTSPNPMVGCLIVKKGKIVGRGFHKRAGLPHAEIEALRKISGRGEVTSPLRGSTLYVNLEPCCHFGRTPPCTEAIIRSGIREVVIGMKDPDPKVSGGGIRILRKAGLRVRVGLLQGECEKLNEAYTVHRKKGRPFVILKMAMTLDGKAGTRGRRLLISGREAIRYGHQLRSEVDAILVGRGTVLHDNPRLTARFGGKKGKNPIRIVLDSRPGLPRTARIFHQAGETIVVTAKKGRVDLKDLLRRLGRRGIVSLLVEGGVEVWGSFLKKKLVDRIDLLLAPKILGKGVSAPLDSLFPVIGGIRGQGLGSDLLIKLDPQSGV
ncbi:MAG: bifunctional diaminohydroxyphosphoribosylaminopyrimidine deaminase/5-amino-6-(5-phosphoribosylamino)uracil reductase RibD [Deltaproteobacteria bacterium]|nr:bifunctional diaminohydroxyphosphoribosylaminopyrimidine deaminase/5-amino-6-(5-phosphoribosylamino)uracil reductase RibD [Deltaproteobacteria bacterium]